MKPALSTRQAQVAECVARGLPDKIIARETKLAIDTVRVHIKAAAAKIPGNSSPRHKLMLWVFTTTQDSTET